MDKKPVIKKEDTIVHHITIFVPHTLRVAEILHIVVVRVAILAHTEVPIQVVHMVLYM